MIDPTSTSILKISSVVFEEPDNPDEFSTEDADFVDTSYDVIVIVVEGDSEPATPVYNGVSPLLRSGPTHCHKIKGLGFPKTPKL